MHCSPVKTTVFQAYLAQHIWLCRNDPPPPLFYLLSLIDLKELNLLVHCYVIHCFFLWWPDFCQTMSLVRVQTWEASFLGLFPCNHWYEINLNTAVKDPRSLSSLLLLRSSSLEWSGEKYRTTMVSRNRNKIQCGQSRLHLFLFLCWIPPSLLAIVNAPTYSAAEEMSGSTTLYKKVGNLTANWGRVLTFALFGKKLSLERTLSVQPCIL